MGSHFTGAKLYCTLDSMVIADLRSEHIFSEEHVDPEIPQTFTHINMRLMSALLRHFGVDQAVKIQSNGVPLTWDTGMIHDLVSGVENNERSIVISSQNGLTGESVPTLEQQVRIVVVRNIQHLRSDGSAEYLHQLTYKKIEHLDENGAVISVEHTEPVNKEMDSALSGKMPVDGSGDSEAVLSKEFYEELQLDPGQYEIIGPFTPFDDYRESGGFPGLVSHYLGRAANAVITESGYRHEYLETKKPFEDKEKRQRVTRYNKFVWGPEPILIK